LEQLERWDLEGTLETANDPFFAAGRAERAFWQRNGERKLELRLPVGVSATGPRKIACASFNRHERFFGAAFGVSTRSGEPAATACVGWGQERWMLACFAQHGFDPGGWPAWLAARAFR
jgi:hypothetical protein